MALKFPLSKKEYDAIMCKPREKKVYKGYQRFLVDDVDRTITTVGQMGKEHIEPFTDTHNMFSKADGPPSMWAIVRQKKEGLQEQIQERI